jgi:hypothetical protein
MTLFNQPKQSMSDTGNEQQFIEAMDRSMLQFFNLHGFYPSQSIEIVKRVGDCYLCYRIERGPVSRPHTAPPDPLVKRSFPTPPPPLTPPPPPPAIDY